MLEWELIKKDTSYDSNLMLLCGQGRVGYR